MTKGSHSVSILTGKEKRCFLTGRTEGLDKHHIYHGTGLRKVSDKHGFWCYVRHELHIAGMGGLHAHPNRGEDLRLKRECQRRFEESHTRAEFMKIIGRNYLEAEVGKETERAEGGFYLIEEADDGRELYL